MGVKKINLAILAPQNQAYSTTFIQAHKELRADQLYFLYGGLVPTSIDNYTYSFFDKLWIIVYKLIGYRTGNTTKRDQLILKYFLKKFKINCVLAEYGTVGARSLPAIQSLHIPLIVHFHGYDASRYSVIETFSKAYKDMFEYADSIIAVSRVMEQKLLKLGAPKEKLVYNPYGPNPHFFDLEPAFSNQLILSVGRFVDKKAPQYSILAFSKIEENFPDARLQFVGDGPLLNACIDLVRYLGMTDKVEFLGIKTPSEIGVLLEEAYMYIQHSVTAQDGDMEGTPNSILEASAAGLPVVSTRHAGIPDVILDLETGLLVDEHDVNTMAEKMEELLKNSELAREMGKRGKERVQSQFTRQQHLDLIQKLID